MFCANLIGKTMTERTHFIRCLLLVSWFCVLGGVAQRSVTLSKEEIEKLNTKLDMIGNEVERVGGLVDLLATRPTRKKAGKKWLPTTPWHPVRFVNASRQELGGGEARFEVVYEIPKGVGFIVRWVKIPIKGTRDKLPFISHAETKWIASRKGRLLGSTSITVPERGTLLIFMYREDFRFEAFLSLDNRNISSTRQRRIHAPQFAVINPDPLFYRPGEDPVVEVKLKGGDPHKVLPSLLLGIQYQSDDGNKSEIREKTCRLNDDNNPSCSTFVKKRYWSATDVNVAIKSSDIHPFGLSKISSTTRSWNQLVRKTQLSRVVNIRPEASATPYHKDVDRIEITSNGCEYFSSDCLVNCKVYGTNLTSVRMERLDPLFQNMRLSHQMINFSITGRIYTARMDVPNPDYGIRETLITCSTRSSEDYSVDYYERKTVKFFGGTRFLKEKSFIEANGTRITLVCAVGGYPFPERPHGLISMAEAENGIEILLEQRNYTDMLIESDTKRMYTFEFHHDLGSEISRANVRGLCQGFGENSIMTDLSVTKVTHFSLDIPDYYNYEN